MLGTQDLLDVLHRELDIIVHLYHKLPDDALDYRPTPGQRSTLELLRYLSYAGIGGVRYAVEGSYDAFREEAERGETLVPDDFPAAIARQRDDIRQVLSTVSDADLAAKEATVPPNETVNLGQALLLMPVRWLTAYRMQLFLYAKAAGNAEIGTANCWVGMDWKG